MAIRSTKIRWFITMVAIVFYNAVLLYLGMPETKHLGQNIARLRDLKGIKQDSLAELLGISQQAISRIEQSESLEDITLERVAVALGITSDAIRHFNSNAAVNILSNVFNDNSSVVYYQFGKEEKISQLYEALLKSEREKIALLEKMIKKLEE